MRLLSFNGKFGYLQEKIIPGFVVFCHFEPGDDKTVIMQVLKKLQSLVKEVLILVPFAHLYEKVASIDDAKILFKQLTFECNKQSKWKVISIPFGIEKEFFLYAPADDSSIKFLKFTKKDKQKDIINLYDKCYIDYDQHMFETRHYQAQERILSVVLPSIKEPIIDLACGTGFIIGLLSRSFGKIVGNDLSKSMTNSIKNKNNFIITNENAESLVGLKEKFNTIISCNLFFYLQNKENALMSRKKHLHTGGKIILIEEYPFIKPISKRMDNHTRKLMSLVDPISPRDIKEIMFNNGFQLDLETKTPIDSRHNLYGLVFSSK